MGAAYPVPVFDPLERALIQHIDFNMMYRWFVGLSLMSRFGDHSTFSANRDRLLKESIMRRFFDGVLGIAGVGRSGVGRALQLWTALLRAWASHKNMAARDGSDEPPGPGSGRNPEVDSGAKALEQDARFAHRPHGAAGDQDARRGLPELHHACARGEPKRLGGRCPYDTGDRHGRAGSGTVMLKRRVERGGKGYTPTVAADRGLRRIRIH